MKFIVTIETISKAPTKAIAKMLDGSEGELFSKAFEINQMLQKHLNRYILISWLLVVPAIPLFIIAGYNIYTMIACVALIFFVFTKRYLYIEKNEYGIKYINRYLNAAIEG